MEVVLYAPEGAAAETYCAANGIRFAVLGEEAPAEAAPAEENDGGTDGGNLPGSRSDGEPAALCLYRDGGFVGGG